MKVLPPILLAVSLVIGGPIRASADDSSPDLVRMNDGRMVRGVILELVPDEFVVIRAHDGVRRVGMEDVAYAGPASSALPDDDRARRLRHAPERADDVVNVRLFGAATGLSLYELTGTA
jgi:hypothetical protein